MSSDYSIHKELPQIWQQNQWRVSFTLGSFPCSRMISRGSQNGKHSISCQEPSYIRVVSNMKPGSGTHTFLSTPLIHCFDAQCSRPYCGWWHGSCSCKTGWKHIRIKTVATPKDGLFIFPNKTLLLSFVSQMSNGSPAPGTSTAASTIQSGSSNQVRPSKACLQQPPPLPHISSSIHPALRRRVSEPLPHTRRRHNAHKPGDTHTRYTYRFNDMERRCAYGYSDDEGGSAQRGVIRDGGVVAHSQTLSSLNACTGGNLNRERCKYGCTRSRTPVAHVTLDNAHVDAQGNANGPKPRHTRSRTLDATDSPDSCQSISYTENIRAMAVQMYGAPYACRPTHADAQSHNCTHNLALLRHHHLRLSGGLWWTLRASSFLLHVRNLVQYKIRVLCVQVSFLFVYL